MSKSESKKFSLSNYSQYMCLVSVILVFVIFTCITPKFVSLSSLSNLMLEAAPMILMAGGISFVIFTGGIDLGTGAMASCTCVLTGLYVSEIGNGILILMLLVGILMGLVNGLLVTKLKLPSFIVTLCTMNFWTYIAVQQTPLGSQSIPLKLRYFVNWASYNVFGIVPVMFIIAIVVVAILFCIQKYTVYGRTIFAVGANVRAARISGVNTDRAQISAFIICGACSALSGAMYAYKLKSAIPTVGDDLGLTAIASVALGGTSMAGGRGSVLRTLIGVITITAVTSGLNMIGVNALWKDIIIGLILIVAVCLNSDTMGRDIIVK